MSNVYDAEANELIEAVAGKLEKLPEMQPPEWVKFVKTGVHKQRPPVRKDWWFVRAASVLRKIYVLGPIGTSKLRTKYGGAQNRGYQPEKFMKGSGNITRKMLQQLEKAGLAMQTSKNGHKGRVATAKGKSLLDKAASEIMKSQKKE